VRSLVTFLASGAGAGYLPLAPGTAGSAVGLILAIFLCEPVWRRSPIAFAILFVALFVAACAIAGAAENYWGEHDSSRIVIDEIFGMIAAMFLNPVRWPIVLAAFLLFRLLDVLKPWPAQYFDRMQGGAGVMLDDLVAAIYTNIALQVLRHVF
jgi:phosphatidylglycerophosphatase A